MPGQARLLLAGPPPEANVTRHARQASSKEQGRPRFRDGERGRRAERSPLRWFLSAVAIALNPDRVTLRDRARQPDHEGAIRLDHRGAEQVILGIVDVHVESSAGSDPLTTDLLTAHRQAVANGWEGLRLSGQWHAEEQDNGNQEYHNWQTSAHGVLLNRG